MVTAHEVTVRLAGQFAVRPVEGETTVLRVTVPVKPPDGVTVIVELPVAPVLKSAGEVAEIVKSALKVKVAVMGWEAVPGVPESVMSTANEPAVGEEQERPEEPVPFAASETGVELNGLQANPEEKEPGKATKPPKLN